MNSLNYVLHYALLGVHNKAFTWIFTLALKLIYL